MSVQRTAWLTAFAATLALTQSAQATIPYTPLPLTSPTIGPSIAPPTFVFGKEYSHDFDHDTAGAGGGADPQQVVAWDGFGGTMDGVDFTGTRPTWTPDQDVDAIANHQDFFTRQLLEDRTHLVFSHDNEMSFITAAGGAVPGSVPSGGPVSLANGQVIGGAGEVSYERAGLFAPPESQGLWASQAEVNGMPLPEDVDGLEVWGPEPAKDGDADKYSLDLDFLSGVSVWNGSGTPYLSHAAVVGAVESLLGPIPGFAMVPFDQQEGRNAINLDAMMVLDTLGEFDTFDGDPAGGMAGDILIFSIRQIIDASDPSGYYATGSELFVLEGSGAVSFLDHGGHVWDKGYALASLAMAGPNTNDLYGVIDINAIESIGAVPEPAAAVMLGAGLIAMVAMRRRLG